MQYCSNGEELQAVGHHRIIISTCSTGGQFYSLGLKPGHFTHVIIDEAGQATEPEALVGIGLAAGPDGQVSGKYITCITLKLLIKGFL